MRDPRFRGYVRTYRAIIPWRGHPWPRVLISHNKLLRDYTWVDGVKTGQTDNAGYCIAASGRFGGRRFIVTLLGEPTPKRRIKDSVALFRFAASLYERRQVVAAGALLAHVQVPYHDEGMDLVVRKPVTALMRAAAQVTSVVSAPVRVSLPLSQGQVLGTVVYKADGVVSRAAGSSPGVALPRPAGRPGPATASTKRGRGSRMKRDACCPPLRPADRSRTDGGRSIGP